ncbi:MAG: orotidine-5'-phosphate decarboxylase [Bacteroidales bacterium]|nr:orotidine-5'-phosphate decarboxylase [Bacteroidales bacterium]MDT8430790.1 orotidine-5'-phosphate decarboxylase [Bacteroidales bacterium]
MTASEIFNNIKKKTSFLCIGLDTDFNKIPRMLLEKEYPIFEFNKRIIDATEDLVVAYKPNLAFYETMGAAGWMSLEMTVNYIRKYFPEIFIIADAKRGDIGNTSGMYANAFFRNLDFDAVTLSPYMGRDSIQPYLDFRNKWSIILGLTSNAGSQDFQQIRTADDQLLFEKVISTAKEWGNTDNTMFVVGATKADQLQQIRRIIPEHFLLVPGIGAQGGNLEEVFQSGFNSQCGLLVNISRSIIYADVTNRFEISARQKAIEIRDQMEELLTRAALI